MGRNPKARHASRIDKLVPESPGRIEQLSMGSTRAALTAWNRPIARQVSSVLARVSTRAGPPRAPRWSETVPKSFL